MPHDTWLRGEVQTLCRLNCRLVSNRALIHSKFCDASNHSIMPFAITLRFDSSSASALEEMWEALSIAGIDSDRIQLGYAPHITLAIYPDDAPVLRLQAALEQVGRHWDA